MSRSVNAILRKHINAKLKPHNIQPTTGPKALTDEEWLAQNDIGIRVVNEPLPILQALAGPTLTEREDYDGIRRFEAMENETELRDVRGVTPGLVRLGTKAEPKSIYSPAPPLPNKLDRKNIRKYAPKQPFVF